MQYSNLESILIKNSQTGFYISTPDGKLLDCNDSFVKMFGYDSKEDVLSYNTTNFYFDINERNRFLEEIHEKNHVQNFSLKAKSKSGKVIYISINSDLYLEKDQSFIVGSIIDITEIIVSKGELAESEKKYRDFIENSPEIIQSFNAEGKLLFCNPIWHEKLEYTSEEAKNMNLFDIIADEFKPHCAALFQEVLAGNSLKDVGVEFVSKTGKRYSLEGNIVPLFENGKMIATHAFFRDVSEKKQAISKIFEQEQLLQTVFNTIPVCLYIKDHNGKYLLANNTMQKTLSSTVVSHHDTEIFPDKCSLQLKDTDLKAIQQPDSLIRFEMEVNFGETIKHFLCGKKAILNEENGNYKLFGFSVDITELKNSTAKIEEKERLLYSIINNSRGGFILFKFNPESECFSREYSNEFADNILNLKPEQLDFCQIFGFLDADTKVKTKIDYVKNAKNYLVTTDWKYKAPDSDSEKTFSLRFTSIRTSENETKLIAFIIDVTEEKKLIEQLEVKLKENDVLIGEVHHRVKNNLAIIDGIIELKKSKTNNEQLNENLTDIQMRIKSIALVHQKLYQSGNFSVVNLYDYVNELSNHYKRLFDNNSSKNISFTINIEKDNILSLSKSIPFGLLLSELISNSCKYGINNNQVKIGISISKNGENCLLNYTDSGNGLPEQLKNLKNGGFGFRLIDNFIKQLKGKSNFPESKHFSFEFEFIP